MPRGDTRAFWNIVRELAPRPVYEGKTAFSAFASDTLRNNQPGNLTKLADALIVWTE